MDLILDFHTHAFPEPLASRAIAHLEELGGIPSYTNGTVSGLQRSMKAAGITHAALCNIVVKPGQTKTVHEFSKSLKENQQNSGIYPVTSLHPKEEHWKDWLKTIKEDGFAGIKLHPGYQQFFINDPDMEKFYLEVFRNDLFILFHAGWDAGYPDPMHASPKRVYDILPVLEQGTTILAHFGGNMRPQQVIDLLCGSNVYFDTSYALGKIPLEDARKIISAHSVDKILFGSDCPWADQKEFVDYFTNTLAPGFLSREDSEKILFGNGAKLLGIIE
mgnify:CR=1 FL=1